MGDGMEGGYKMAYPLADMVGHVSWLQMGLLRSSVVLMMLIICSSKRYCSTTKVT
jgi:hypothetical protein